MLKYQTRSTASKTPYHDAIFDIFLTSYGYLPIWKKFDLLEKAKSKEKYSKAFVQLYEDIKTMTFIDGYVWGDFMLDSNPLDSWGEWKAEAKLFLDNADAYTKEAVVIKTRHNWAKANKEVPKVFPVYMKRFVYQLDICSLYDGVWPRVGLNYRTFELDAFLNKKMKEKVYAKKEVYSVLPPVAWLD